ncbi:hypothetical protein MPTK1_4g05260 [Marchantia polymorpha subsp. ruderalis]|nr:hypothetical protein MARPO_0087s0063 [Marchantia polymorpha]BBN07641.1 hypothetical protein Mp_4g05260 [Marchantia polymorpha subsp. ruderalis]|eukprot:PTQ33630.1 hypothetical protein MARPO_0087s0063 [Marchantia polymorpha]
MWGLVSVGLVTTGVTLVAAPVVVPALVKTLGFTSEGIAPGSWAAGYMASYGGLVGAGSTCAVLQSIGVTGTLAGAGVLAAVGVAAAGLGVVIERVQPQ